MYATLIADGALFNGRNGIPVNWIASPDVLSSGKLTIYGRLFSYNTRGGSLRVNTSTLTTATDVTARCFNGSATPGNCTAEEAASQDLERFRLTTTPPTSTPPTSGNNQCTLYVTGATPTIPILSHLTS